MSLYIGANYHPHDWPPERWEIDLELMRKAGFTTVRMGHLCWDSYEPEDGVYTFEWFDQVMDICAEKGIGVVLDVSMHPVPIWVHKKCPGCDIGGKNGDLQAPLTRYMDDVMDPEYQHYALRFAEVLVNRYKEHPALFAFGLCNELGGGYPTYSRAARMRFIEWLKNKYGTIEELNKYWATQRWSRRIPSFDDVAMPVNEFDIGSPEAWLDMRRFFSDGISDFLVRLGQTVKKNAPQVPQSCNHYAEFKELGYDYLKVYPKFADYVGNGFYPAYNDRDSVDFDTIASWFMARIAETKKPMWCLEFVTGGFGIHSSWYGINRMYIFWCLLHRSQMFLGWTYRSMLNGEEQILFGLVNHDGTPNQNFKEFAWAASDLKKLEKYAFPYVPDPDIAIADSFDSKMIAQYHPRQFRQPYEHQLALSSRVFERRNLDYNVVNLRDMQGDYKLLIVPGYIVMDEASALTIRRFVENGGNVIMTGYSAMFHEYGGVFDTPRPGRLNDVFGIRIESFWRTSGLELPEEFENRIKRNPENGHELLSIEKDGEKFSVDVDYFEIMALEGAQIYAQEMNHGICAVSKNKYGKGTAYYVFSETNDIILGWLFDKISKEIGICPAPDVPDGIMVRKTADNQTFYLNITGREIEVWLPKAGYGVLREEQDIVTLKLKAYDGELIVTD